MTRLSERNLNTSLESTFTSTSVKKSKFFGSKSAQKQEEAVQLVWHSSSDASQPNEAGSSRSPSASPVPSVVSPTKAAEGEESFSHLTSPVAPVLSSPIMSSPPCAETLTSPRRPASTRSRSTTPLSPTQTGHQKIPNVLIPSTSQMPNFSQTPKHTLAPSSPTHHQSLRTSTYSNHPSSSDSFEFEEVVTPSLPDCLRQSRPASRESLGKRQRSDEDVVQDDERASKAKIIAKDWRLKYAFGGANVSPLPAFKPCRRFG